MMSTRQQQDSSYLTKINKKAAVFMHSSSKGSNVNQNEVSINGGLITMASSDYGADYEREESPVSVISHSASVISQPSSACTSLEHHLMLDTSLINPKSFSNQKFSTSNYACNQEQFCGTSAASISEDDSLAYHLPTLFSEGAAPLQEEPSKAGGSTKRVVCCQEELGTKGSFNLPINNKSFINSSEASTIAADSLNSDDDDDDEHTISIDLQDLEENHMVLREKLLKGNRNKLAKEEKKALDKCFAKLKQYDEWKKVQKLERSTSNGQEALVGRPYNEPASKIANFSSNYNYARDRTTTHLSTYEGGHQSAHRNSIEKATPNLASRQKSINSSKLMVSSKWDDAEKWLCYDNYASPHKAKNSPISGQKLHNNDAILDRGNASFSEANNEYRNNHASPHRVSLSVNKAYECKDKHGLKDEVEGLTLANPLMMQIIPSRGGESIHVMSRDKHAFSSQISNSNELLVSKTLKDDNLRRKWFGTAPSTCRHGEFDYMSSGEIINPHVLSNKPAATTASDGEIHTNIASSSYQHYYASQTSISSGSPLEGELNKKDDFKTTFERWKKDNYDESVLARQIRECDYLSSGDLVRHTNNRRKSIAICARNGERYVNYASDQQYASDASYAQRFKQYYILQKLKRKCSSSHGGFKGAAQHVREDGSQNLDAKNSNGRVASVHAASRLSGISVQASPKKDRFCTQGEYTTTQSIGRLREEDAGGELVCIDAGMQREFVVQTPTHGRSASMKDACTEVSPSLSRRDVGTQMTPCESSPTSPVQSTSPARHNTPTHTSPTLNPQMNNCDIARDDEDEINSSTSRMSQYNNGNALELESCHWAKLELKGLPSGSQTNSEENNDLGSVYNDGSPAICLEEGIVSDEGHHDIDAVDVDDMYSGDIMKKLSVLDARAASWEEAERAKYHVKYKREEARINAWETLQKAKAEAELNKLEVKLERLRSRATEKVLSRVTAAEKRAEEMRATAEAQKAEQMRKIKEKACNLCKTALFPGSFAVCFARNYTP